MDIVDAINALEQEYFLKPKEIAKACNVSVSAVYKWCKKGKLRGVKYANTNIWFITSKMFSDFLSEHDVYRRALTKKFAEKINNDKNCCSNLRIVVFDVLRGL